MIISSLRLFESKLVVLVPKESEKELGKNSKHSALIVLIGATINDHAEVNQYQVEEENVLVISKER